jgi:hypothetical protein
MLPKGRLATAKVELSGGAVEIHALTLGQSRIAADLEGMERVVAAIAFSTGTDKPDVEEWLDSAPAGDATKLIEAIMKVSDLDEGAQFPQ